MEDLQEATFEIVSGYSLIKGKFNNKAIYIVSVYLNCGHWNEHFHKLYFMLERSSDFEILLIGDLNGRIGQHQVLPKDLFIEGAININRKRKSKDDVINLNGEYNKIYKHGKAPYFFKDTIIYPLYKKGDVNCTSNYRGISFGNAMSEIKLRRFDTLDYLIFTTMLVLSALTGLYFARGGQKTISSYLFGDKKLSLLPVSFSLVTTFVSGTFLLGVPTEIYLNGIQFIYSTFLSFFAIIFMVYLIIPVLYNLQLISLFEGGLKAVVWTDTLQAIVILASVISVIILGLQRVGGVSQMIQIGLKGDRIEWLDMTLDPKIRITFWSLLFGSNFLTLSQYGTNPAAFQRYLSMPDLKKAQRSVFFLYFGMSFSLFLTAIIGLILYAAYRGCDPVSTKEIKRADQLFPFFVMEISENLKGVPGLFLAGIVGAALSTMSTTINTITGTIYKDFLEPFVFPKTNDAKATLILYNAIGGVITGIFLLGLFVPFANSYPIMRVRIGNM
uniref:Uncharacterized protein n=1 Tax=Rhodnius prolixus TaxID=13249 RepID=T1HT05_RHOPR